MIHLAREWIGGGEAVALSSVEALKDDYDVTLVGRTRPDLERLNALFGTRLDFSQFRFVLVPPAAALLGLLPRRFELIHEHLQPMRFCRSLASEFDVMVSTFNDMDLGKPGIQYCHHPGMAMLRPEVARRVIDSHTVLPSSFALRCRVARLMNQLAGYRERRVYSNVTVANSTWTARIMERAYGGRVEVVHPPIAEVPDPQPWHARECGFVCVGRLVRTKRIQDVLAILDRVRARGHAVHLHLVSSSVDPEYLAELGPRLRARSEWVQLERDLAQPELHRLLSRHRYGIHAMENEHFGMVIAEMIKAGIIPFVPRSGGQVEIVADPGLTYTSLDDAAAKIERLLGDPELAGRTRDHLSRQAERFSRAKFAAALKALVARQLSGAPS